MNGRQSDLYLLILSRSKISDFFSLFTNNLFGNNAYSQSSLLYSTMFTEITYSKHIEQKKARITFQTKKIIGSSAAGPYLFRKDVVFLCYFIFPCLVICPNKALYVFRTKMKYWRNKFRRTCIFPYIIYISGKDIFFLSLIVCFKI